MASEYNEFKAYNASPKEFVLYKLREFMGLRGVGGLTIIFMSIPIFLLMKICNEQMHITIIAALFPFVILCVSFFVMRHGYGKYIEDFKHKSFTNYRILSGTFYVLIFIILICYTMIKSLNFDYMSLVVLCVFVIFIFSAIFYLKMNRVIRINFDKIYYEVNGRPFILSKMYTEIASELSTTEKVMYAIYLAIALLTGSMLRSSGDLAWGVVGIGMVFTVFLIIGLHVSYIPALYQLFVLQPRIEKKFNGPLLSDFFCILEADRQMGDKILGPSPKRRPMQYEEVFPQKSKE